MLIYPQFSLSLCGSPIVLHIPRYSPVVLLTQILSPHLSLLCSYIPVFLDDLAVFPQSCPPLQGHQGKKMTNENILGYMRHYETVAQNSLNSPKTIVMLIFLLKSPKMWLRGFPQLEEPARHHPIGALRRAPKGGNQRIAAGAFRRQRWQLHRNHDTVHGESGTRGTRGPRRFSALGSP